MSAPLDAIAAAVAAADLWLILICWRRRTVLGGVAGLIAIPTLAFAAAHGLSGGAARAAVLIALIFLIVGAVLLGLGQTLQRLLETPGDELPRD